MNTLEWTMLLTVVTCLVALAWLLTTGSRIALAISLTVSILFLAWWGWLDWVLRDGFFSKSTSGTEALHKFINHFWTTLLVWGVFVAGALAVFWFKRQRSRV